MVSDTVLSYMWCQYEIHGFKGLSEGVKQPASVASEQIWKCDEHVQCETPKKLFYPPHYLGWTRRSTRFCERFHEGQYSLVSFLFVKVGGYEPPCSMDSAPVARLRSCVDFLISSHAQRRRLNRARGHVPPLLQMAGHRGHRE